MISNSSPFIEKLQEILNNSQNSEAITFSEANGRLQIADKKKLENILPKYFRHARFQSFVRQLNWYGFYKINNKNSNFYSHPDLQKGQKLASIKSRRKPSNSKKNLSQSNQIEEFPINKQISQSGNHQSNKLQCFVPFQGNWVYNNCFSIKDYLFFPNLDQNSIINPVMAQNMILPYFGNQSYE